MARNRGQRAPNGTGSQPVRTFRMEDATWDRAARRAAFEGTTMSAIIVAFVEGYANGKINPPRLQMIYDVPEQQAVGNT